MNYIINVAKNIQLQTLEECRKWNKAIKKNKHCSQDSTFATIKNILKKQLARIKDLPAKSLEEQAEIWIAKAQISLLLDGTAIQEILDNICKLSVKLTDSPLKVKLLIILYAITKDEKDLAEAMLIMRKWGKNNINSAGIETIRWFERLKEEELV